MINHDVNRSSFAQGRSNKCEGIQLTKLPNIEKKKGLLISNSGHSNNCRFCNASIYKAFLPLKQEHKETNLFKFSRLWLETFIY